MDVWSVLTLTTFENIAHAADCIWFSDVHLDFMLNICWLDNASRYNYSFIMFHPECSLHGFSYLKFDMFSIARDQLRTDELPWNAKPRTQLVRLGHGQGDPGIFRVPICACYKDWGLWWKHRKLKHIPNSTIPFLEINSLVCLLRTGFWLTLFWNAHSGPWSSLHDLLLRPSAHIELSDPNEISLGDGKDGLCPHAVETCATRFPSGMTSVEDKKLERYSCDAFSAIVSGSFK
jgi:hypothetical protein